MTDVVTNEAPANQAPAGSKENPIQMNDDGTPKEIPQSSVNVQSAASQQAQQAQAQQEQQSQEPATLVQAEVVESSSNTIKQVNQLLNSKGVEGGAEIVRELARDGEVSLANQAKLIEALGPEVANLVTNQMKQEVQSKKDAGLKESNRIKDYAQSKFGGESADKTWGELQQWVNSNESPFDQADRKAMEKLLSKGGLGADMVIDKIFDTYSKSSGFTKQADLIMGDAPSTSNFKPISKADYVAQKLEVVRKYGEGSREDQALDAQRMRSLQQGY